MTKELIWNTVGLSEGRLRGEKIVLKVKVHPGTGHKGPEGSRGMALLFL